MRDVTCAPAALLSNLQVTLRRHFISIIHMFVFDLMPFTCLVTLFFLLLSLQYTHIVSLCSDLVLSALIIHVA